MKNGQIVAQSEVSEVRACTGEKDRQWREGYPPGMGDKSQQDEDGIPMKGQPGAAWGTPRSDSPAWAIRASR